MKDRFQIDPVGIVRKQDKTVIIEIHEKYKDGLLGLDRFSHILVYFWFHKNDTREYRKTLLVHPRGDKANPLTGVFATRSPKRPNLIGMSECNILSIDGTAIHIDKIDAFHGSPVIDIKPHMPELDSISNVVGPDWAIDSTVA